jgi:hypothetical protein
MAVIYRVILTLEKVRLITVVIYCCISITLALLVVILSRLCAQSIHEMSMLQNPKDIT